MAVIVMALGATADAQKAVQGPGSGASIAEVKKWIVEGLPKYASYKTRSGSSAVSQVRFDDCTLKFVMSKRVGTTTAVTEGAKRTVSSSKDEFTFDLRGLESDDVSLSDHLYPELQTLEIRRSRNEPPIEIVLKRPAAEAVRSALLAMGRLCPVTD